MENNTETISPEDALYAALSGVDFPWNWAGVNDQMGGGITAFTIICTDARGVGYLAAVQDADMGDGVDTFGPYDVSLFLESNPSDPIACGVLAEAVWASDPTEAIAVVGRLWQEHFAAIWTEEV